jgi:hypothetical protein|tara:strand:- start:9 stop:797 length:789 start_codon:yes stop_codon:yes gene_type:complete
MIEHFKKFDGGGKKDLLPLSFSQLTEFAFHRERWALKRLYGYEFPSSPAMERGKAVESGLNMWLNGIDADDSIKKMQQEYDTNCNAFENAKIPEERENLVPLFNEGIDRLKDYAFKLNLIGYQEKVEMDIQGIPLVGYTDFHFIDMKTKEDIYIDLKTTLRKPGGISNSHAIQQAIYQSSTNSTQKLWYLVCKKSGTEFYEFSLDNYTRPMQICEHIVKVMGNWLSKVDSLDDVKNLLIPNPDDWIWKEEAVYKARMEVWGY